MPVYVICKSCESKIHLPVKRRAWLPPAFRLKCPVCGYEGVYSQSDAVEEGIYTFTCPVCRKRFYIAREPPVKVLCPHCNSTLYIPSARAEPVVVKASEGQVPVAVAAAALLGALVGAVVSRGKLRGAVAGGLIGALIGAVVDSLSEPEAKYAE